jgi:Cu(I)/Ag(I) efflux system membrane fusion protein
MTFQGKIVAITPILSAETRSLRVRVEVDDPEHKLKPEMFVNAKIAVNLGEKLAVPESAVLDTGTRKIVYLFQEDDRVELREVTLGQKAQGYFEVLSGLNERDTVVTSGNFLIDSESKLQGAIEGASGHQHGQ